MSNTKTEYRRHTIWSSEINIEDWRDDYVSFLEEFEGEHDPVVDDYDLYRYAETCNWDYLDDERTNLNDVLRAPIIVFGDLGFWDGRRQGYKIIETGNIADCLYTDDPICEWYVDEHGDLRSDSAHHDGTNHMLYRKVKDRYAEWLDEILEDPDADIIEYTEPLGSYIAVVYGWDDYSD